MEVPVQDLRSAPISWQFLSAVQSSLGPESSSPFPSISVSVPVSDSSSGPSGPHLLSKKGAPQPRASQRHRGSVKGRRPPHLGSPQHVSSRLCPCQARGSVGGWEIVLGLSDPGGAGEMQTGRQGQLRPRTGGSAGGDGGRNGQCTTRRKM